MKLIYPDEGLTIILKRIVGDGLTWALFTNDVEVTEESVLTDFDLASDTWGQSLLDAEYFTISQVIDHIGSIQGDPLTFVNSEASPVDVFGILVYDESTLKLISAARFNDAPRTLAPTGRTTVPVIIGDYSESLVPTIDGGTF